MYCEKCKQKINTVLIDMFDIDGSDCFCEIPIYEEYEEYGAVELEVNNSWTGYELDGEEQADTIKCPRCKKYPFSDRNMNVFEVVKIICFKKDKEW